MTFKQLLEQRNYTQDKLAKELGITQVAVSKWVRGVSVPTTNNILKIAEALHVDSIDIVKIFYK